jgi:hypothetical protein
MAEWGWGGLGTLPTCCLPGFSPPWAQYTYSFLPAPPGVGPAVIYMGPDLSAFHSVQSLCVPECTHAHAFAHIQIYSYISHIYLCIHIPMHIHSLQPYTHISVLAYICTHSYTTPHIYMYITHTYTCTCKPIYKDIHTCTHTHSCTPIQTYIGSFIHSHEHTCLAHTHVYLYIHTQVIHSQS